MKYFNMHRSAAAAGLLLLAPLAVQAGTIVGADSVSASLPDLSTSYGIGNLINQSGISASYTSGVTDFDTFVGTATLSTSPSSSNGWASTTYNTFPASIDFVFGTELTLSRLALWNDTDSQALGGFQVFSATDSSFTSLTSLGSFTATSQSVGSLAQVFDFTDTLTQYLRISGAPVLYNNGLLNIGEVAFEQISAPVPVPAALPLLGAGLATLGLAARRSKA